MYQIIETSESTQKKKIRTSKIFLLHSHKFLSSHRLQNTEFSVAAKTSLGSLVSISGYDNTVEGLLASVMNK